MIDFTMNKDCKFLYKYLPFNQYSLQILIDHQFWLGTPGSLNDPFEGDFIINNYKQFHNRKFIKTLIKKEYNDDLGLWKTTLQGYTIDFLLKDEYYFLFKLYEQLNNSMKLMNGTTSFSKNCTSLKMWSHYADSHKGFIIIFDRAKLETIISENNIKLIDVQYKSLPSIEIDYSSNKISIKDDSILLTRKLTEWKSEEEVRIIKKMNFKSDRDRFLKFEFDCISGIIFGQQFKDENISTIQRLIFPEKNDVKLYHAIKNLSRNKITFKKMKPMKIT